MLVLNAVFITVYHVKAFQDDISAKTVPIWLLYTVTNLPKLRDLTERDDDDDDDDDDDEGGVEEEADSKISSGRMCFGRTF